MHTTLSLDAQALIAGCAKRDSDLAEWAVQWLDGYDGAEITHEDGEWHLITQPDTWYADDGDCEIEVSEPGIAGAQEYVDGADYGETDRTFWVNVWVYQIGIDEEGEERRVNADRHKVDIDPPEPDCVDGAEHDWQDPVSVVGGCRENPGVFGHGAGVYMHSVCVHCGCRRTVDTWAQDPEDGEQGLESVEYDAYAYGYAVLPYRVTELVREMPEVPELCDAGREAAAWLIYVIEGEWLPKHQPTLSVLCADEWKRLHDAWNEVCESDADAERSSKGHEIPAEVVALREIARDSERVVAKAVYNHFDS